jgi:Zn-dependent protease with chaperone function
VRIALLAAGAGLAAFFAVAFALSLLAALAARRVRDDEPVRAARRLFWLRLLPTLLASVAAAAFALPAFLRFEPNGAEEAPGVTFLLLASAGALALLSGACLAGRDLALTRRLRRAWLRGGRPLALEGAPAPAVGMAHPFPVVCVVGVLRPRVFVSDAVLHALSPAQMRALLAHERAHVSSADNFRRLLLRGSAPLPWPSLARALERRWQDVSEEAADIRAGAGVDLASALVATARLAPPGSRLELGAAAFHRGGAITRRVRRLCSPASGPAAAPHGARRLALGAALGAAAGMAAWPHVVQPAYRLLEALVHLP